MKKIISQPKPTIPGSEIRVTEGDHVKFIFHNQQKEPHTDGDIPPLKVKKDGKSIN